MEKLDAKYAILCKKGIRFVIIIREYIMLVMALIVIPRE